MKKIKKDYLESKQLLLSYDLYKASQKKLLISEEKYKFLKDEILKLEHRYPSLKKMGKDLVLRANLRYPDGRIYKGAIKSVKQQIPHGHGFMCLNRTDVEVESKTFGKKLTDNPWDYIGEFKDGVFHGKGEYKCKGNYSYKGEWKKSHFHGKGKFINEKKNETYEGDFVNDKRHGYGVLTTEYFKLEGPFKNNEPNGKFKITELKDTDQYEKGTTSTGIMKNGLAQGMFEKIYPDNDIMDCMYVDNVCTKARFRGQKKWTYYKK